MSSSCGSATTRTWNGIPPGWRASAASLHRSSAVQPRDADEEAARDDGGGGGIDPSQTRPLTEGESSNPHDHEAATRKLRISAQSTSKTRRARRRRTRDGGSGGVRVRGRRGCGRGRREGERMIGDETILRICFPPPVHRLSAIESAIDNPVGAGPEAGPGHDERSCR